MDNAHSSSVKWRVVRAFLGLAAGRALGTGNGIAQGQEAVCERRRAVGERRRVLHSIACRVSAMRQSETHDRSLGKF